MECPHYNKCSSPLCPLDEDSLENGIWFPDEEICKRNEFARKTWVRNQKKIQRRAKNINGYFTLNMLKRNCVVKGGICGIDPDKPAESQIEAWLAAHKTKRKLSEEEKKVLRDRFKKALTSNT